MQFKATKQFAREDEKPFAEFKELVHAELFIQNKIAADNMQSTKLVYRIYQNDKLLRELNKEQLKVPLKPGQYAEGDNFMPRSLALPFSVFEQANSLGTFESEEDAKLFAQGLLSLDRGKVFKIYHANNLITEMSANDLTESSSGKGQAASFRPTPLQTAPRPPGTPPKNYSDDEDKK